MTLATPGSKPYVLLTGATGMVGSHLMARLLARQVPLAVLVREETPAAERSGTTAQERVEELLGKFEGYWQRWLKRPVVLVGDINRQELGLSADHRRWVADHCRSVIHSAASLSFRPASESPENEPYRSNLDGTGRVAATCAAQGISDFHYISTAYVCGVRDGWVGETQAGCGQTFANDYEQSKLQAEQLLRERAEWRELTIYRPSIVIDSTGLAPISQDRTIYSAFSMFHSLASRFGLPELGTWSRNLGLSGQERKNVVEAAWVAEAIAGIFAAPDLHGRTYHLTASTGTSTSQMEQAFYNVTVESFRKRGLVVPELREDRGDGRPRAKPAAGSTSLTGSAVLDAIAAPFVEAFLPHFRNDPIFGRDNIDAAVQRLGLPEQGVIDAELIAKMIRLPGCFREMLDPGSVADRPAAQSSAVESRPTLRMRAACLREQTRPSDSPRRGGADREACADAWGVLICGCCGGDYRIQFGSEIRVGQGGEACDKRLYLSAEDWDALIAGECALDELLVQGRLSVESDTVAAQALCGAAHRPLARLIHRLQQEFAISVDNGNRLLAAGKGV